MANRIITDEMVETLAKWASPDAFVFGQEALSKQPAALARSRKILETLAPMFLAEAQWQPIETAPRDGTFILVCANLISIKATRIVAARWVRRTVKKKGQSFKRENWRGGGFDFRDDMVTHWMPLPAPPEPKG